MIVRTFLLLVTGSAFLLSSAHAQRGTLGPDDPVLDGGEFYDVHEVDLVAGSSITIRIDSAEFDPYLMVMDPNGDAGFQVDDSPGHGLNVATGFTPALDGTHLVVVTSATAGERGAYELTVDVPGANDPFLGEFRSDEMTLRLRSSGEGYDGTLLFGGEAMPLTARVEGRSLVGSFAARGASFAFEAALKDGVMTLESGGAVYRLERPNPLAPREGATPPPQAPNPLALPDLPGDATPAPSPAPVVDAAGARLWAPASPIVPAIPPVALEPYAMKGVVVDRHGAPIADARVTVYGTTIAGEDAYFETRTGADGTFRQRVPDGIYGISAEVELAYAGDVFEIDVPEVAGDTGVAHDAERGGVESFVWYGSGLRRPDRDPADEDAYYGMSFDVRAAPTFAYGPHLANATLEVRLAPEGSLMDGTEGDALLYRHVFAAEGPHVEGTGWGDTIDLWWTLLDVPAGSYAMTARLIGADGSVTPLRASDDCCDAATLQEVLVFHPTAYDITRSVEPYTSKYVGP